MSYPDPALFDSAPEHTCPYCRDARVQGLVGCLRHTSAESMATLAARVDELVHERAKQDTIALRRDLEPS